MRVKMVSNSTDPPVALGGRVELSYELSRFLGAIFVAATATSKERKAGRPPTILAGARTGAGLGWRACNFVNIKGESDGVMGKGLDTVH